MSDRGIAYRETTHWTDRAACRDEEPELFFPYATDAAGIQYAKSICARCVVADSCLDEELKIPTHLDRDGIRGGYTASERRGIREARRG